MHIPQLVWGAEKHMHIHSLLLLDTPAFNYQLHWSFLPCALRARNTALCCYTAANKLICRRTTAVISLLNYCYFV
jgi:hypothetical protein